MKIREEPSQPGFVVSATAAIATLATPILIVILLVVAVSYFFNHHGPDWRILTRNCALLVAVYAGCLLALRGLARRRQQR